VLNQRRVSAVSELPANVCTGAAAMDRAARRLLKAERSAMIKYKVAGLPLACAITAVALQHDQQQELERAQPP
jgi:hypothetical protein